MSYDCGVLGVVKHRHSAAFKKWRRAADTARDGHLLALGHLSNRFSDVICTKLTITFGGTVISTCIVTSGAFQRCGYGESNDKTESE